MMMFISSSTIKSIRQNNLLNACTVYSLSTCCICVTMCAIRGRAITINGGGRGSEMYSIYSSREIISMHR